MGEFLAAIRAGDVDQVRVILQAGIEVDATGSLPFTALLCACVNGHEGVMRILLDAGAGRLSVTQLSHALICASQNGHEGATRLLLEAGVEVNLKDIKGLMALIMACKNGHEGAVRLLCWGPGQR